jgi:SPP1 gp7 family putative phage head morphogenesis protein
MQASAIKKFINQRAKEFATSVNDTTLQGLESTLSEGISSGEKTSQLVDRVNEVYSDFPMYRSELIARTESAAANNEGLLQSFDQSGVMNGKEWIAVLDDRTDEDCKDTDGEIVLIHEKFSNGSMYPPLHPNCRCVLGGAFIE